MSRLASTTVLRDGVDPRQDGFTLIELLVSLAVLAAILGLLAGGLRVISQNWDANARRIETLDMISRAADILRRDAAGMQRLVAVGDRQAPPHYVFAGSVDHISFVTLEPPYPTASGPYFVNYSIASNGANIELVRARTIYRAGMQSFPGATPANRVALVQGPYRYAFSFAEKAEESSRWVSDWPSPTRLPDLIRLQVVDARTHAPVGPSVVVAIRADAELGCLANKSGACSANSRGALSEGASKSATETEDDDEDASR